MAEMNNKPRIILDYNQHKAGVDTLDQVVRGYSCRRKCRRWPFTMFCNLLDIATYNAYILYLGIHPNYKNGVSHRRREFLKELGKSMLPEVEVIMPVATQLPQAAGGPVRIKRCYLCSRSHDKKSHLMCSKCNDTVYKGHLKSVCINCL